MENITADNSYIFDKKAKKTIKVIFVAMALLFLFFIQFVAEGSGWINFNILFSIPFYVGIGIVGLVYSIKFLRKNTNKKLSVALLIFSVLFTTWYPMAFITTNAADVDAIVRVTSIFSPGKIQGLIGMIRGANEQRKFYGRFQSEMSSPLIAEKYGSTLNILYVRSEVSNNLYKISFITKENATYNDNQIIIPQNSAVKVVAPSLKEYLRAGSQASFAVRLKILDFVYMGRMDNVEPVDEKNNEHVMFTSTKEEICKRDSGSEEYYNKCIRESFGF